MCRKFRSVKITGRASIKPKKKILVDPFKVEQHCQGFADTDVGEDGPSGIEDIEGARLGHRGQEGLFHDAAVAQRRKIISRLPATRVLLGAPIMEAAS